MALHVYSVRENLRFVIARVSWLLREGEGGEEGEEEGRGGEGEGEREGERGREKEKEKSRQGETQVCEQAHIVHVGVWSCSCSNSCVVHVCTCT